VPSYALYLVPFAGFLYLLILIYAVSVIRLNFFFKSINSSNHQGIILTFDDGPNLYTDSILNTLKKHDIKASFFLIGQSIDGNEEIVKRINEDGHTIGNHSFSHDNFLPLRSSKLMAKDINLTNDKLKDLGIECKLYRPPFGVCNPRVGRAIKKTDMIPVGWNFRTYDTKMESSDKLLNKLLSQVNSNSLILMHDSEKITADILDQFITEVKSRGLKFATLKA
jgi:peptidoglycan/xylan/chitin deacetylase (PgdA/CDA1 family)